MSDKQETPRSVQHEFAVLAEKVAKKYGVFFSYIAFNWEEQETVAGTEKYIASVDSSTNTTYKE